MWRASWRWTRSEGFEVCLVPTKGSHRVPAPSWGHLWLGKTQKPHCASWTSGNKAGSHCGCTSKKSDQPTVAKGGRQVPPAYSGGQHQERKQRWGFSAGRLQEAVEPSPSNRAWGEQDGGSSWMVPACLSHQMLCSCLWWRWHYWLGAEHRRQDEVGNASCCCNISPRHRQWPCANIRLGRWQRQLRRRVRGHGQDWEGGGCFDG